jgi:hypothetical protein
MWNIEMLLGYFGKFPKRKKIDKFLLGYFVGVSGKARGSFGESLREFLGYLGYYSSFGIIFSKFKMSLEYFVKFSKKQNQVDKFLLE